MKTPILFAALFIAAQAHAAAVWRCEAEGRVVYSDTACGQGLQGRAVDAADARTPEQVAAAHAVLAADQRRAEAMRRERLEFERRAAPVAPPIRTSALRSPDRPLRQALPKKPRPEDAGTWRATAPSSRRTKG